MTNTDNQIYFNFSYFALKLLGKGLYSNPWAAISELVANGLDAEASKVKILIDMRKKENTIIEILDNGTGMTYKDLSQKYVFLGKDKRNDSDITDELKNRVMGRKGVGKLATLFLSRDFYLLSKTSNESSAWYFNMDDGSDSDIPSLNRVKNKDVKVLSYREWDSFPTGTAIILNHVDFTNVGVKTIEGLKARLADFYLINSISGRIDIAVLTDENQVIEFVPIEKNIAYRNFYALFDNSGLDIKKKISNKVYFPSSFDEIKNIPRNTKILDCEKFNVSGSKKFKLHDGSYTTESIPYELRGWIGMHSSIKKEDAQINDSSFLKNKAYRSNTLRLYVRGKLAVEDLMPYIGNTQVFANYIEGEISFDILDDNKLEDIATSNRQDFDRNDERIQLLIDIIKPIITSLIAERVNIGSVIRKEEQNLRKSLEEEKEKAERAKKIAQDEKKVETKKRKAAEKAAQRERTRSQYILSISDIPEKDIINTVHTVYNKSLLVKKNLNRMNSDTTISKKTRGYLEKAATSNGEILILSKLISRTHKVFENNDAERNVELVSFINEYIEKAASKIYKKDMTFSYSGDINATFYMDIKPVSFVMAIDNIIGNSKKAASRNITISFDDSDEDYFIVNISNDGQKLDETITDIESLFDFGVTTTDGSGLGLFYARKQIEQLGGNISMTSNADRGITTMLRFRRDSL